MNYPRPYGYWTNFATWRVVRQERRARKNNAEYVRKEVPFGGYKQETRYVCITGWQIVRLFRKLDRNNNKKIQEAEDWNLRILPYLDEGNKELEVPNYEQEIVDKLEEEYQNKYRHDYAIYVQNLHQYGKRYAKRKYAETIEKEQKELKQIKQEVKRRNKRPAQPVASAYLEEDIDWGIDWLFLDEELIYNSGSQLRLTAFDGRLKISVGYVNLYNQPINA